MSIDQQALRRLREELEVLAGRRGSGNARAVRRVEFEGLRAIVAGLRAESTTAAAGLGERVGSLDVLAAGLEAAVEDHTAALESQGETLAGIGSLVAFRPTEIAPSLLELVSASEPAGDAIAQRAPAAAVLSLGSITYALLSTSAVTLAGSGSGSSTDETFATLAMPRTGFILAGARRRIVMPHSAAGDTATMELMIDGAVADSASVSTLITAATVDDPSGIAVTNEANIALSALAVVAPGDRSVRVRMTGDHASATLGDYAAWAVGVFA